MDVSNLSIGTALQAATVQGKEKPDEQAAKSLPIEIKASEQLQSHLTEEQIRVKNTSETNTEANLLKKPETEQELKETFAELAKKIKEKLQTSGIDVQLDVRKEAGRVFMLIKNPTTDKVVRQIPSENFVKILESIKEVGQNITIQGVELDVRL